MPVIFIWPRAIRLRVRP